MPFKKTLLAGLLGGIAVFLWGAISHMVLPLGNVGFKQLPNEEAALAFMQTNLPEAGLYFFPYMDPSGNAEQMKIWEEKLSSGPAGLMVYQPRGKPMTAGQLLREFLFNVLGALVAAFLLGKMEGGSGLLGRAVLVALLGLFSGLDVDLSYWNWYGFPGSYTAAVMTDHIIGWFLGGLVIAWVLKPRQPAV